MSAVSLQNDIEAILPDFGRLEYSENRNENFRLIQSEFVKSARSILWDYELVYKECRWPVSALELYFYHASFWPDGTTHFKGFPQKQQSEQGTGQQLQRGTWYVHRGGKPAPNRSGIDITAGCEKKEIAAGLLISGIGKRPGSATAFKAVVRHGQDYVFRRNDKWSTEDKAFIKAINGELIGECVLTLQRRESKMPQPLWIGQRKLGKKQGDTEFGRRHLRVATFRTTTPPMIELKDEMAIG